MYVRVSILIEFRQKRECKFWFHFDPVCINIGCIPTDGYNRYTPCQYDFNFSCLYSQFRIHHSADKNRHTAIASRRMKW
jgi:hypothetical protein